MRYITSLLLILPAALFAQSADTLKNNIGVFGETNLLFSGSKYWNTELSTVGLQYVKASGKYLNYKVSIGYGNSQQNPEFDMVQAVHGDTVWRKSGVNKVDLAILGLGAELQRQFYKRLYFFGGFEIRAGYGVGYSDTFTKKEYKGAYFNTSTGTLFEVYGAEITDKKGPEVTMAYAGFTPYFGFKLVFRRFSVGTSFMNYITYNGTIVNGLHDSFVNFDLNNITQQVFVRYRF